MRINALNYRSSVLCKRERDSERETKTKGTKRERGIDKHGSYERKKWHIRQKSEGLWEGRERYYGKEKEGQKEQGREMGHKEQKTNGPNLTDAAGEGNWKIEKDKERYLHSGWKTTKNMWLRKEKSASSPDVYTHSFSPSPLCDYNLIFMGPHSSCSPFFFFPSRPPPLCLLIEAGSFTRFCAAKRKTIVLSIKARISSSYCCCCCCLVQWGFVTLPTALPISP